jgi:hypothetical protein
MPIPRGERFTTNPARDLGSRSLNPLQKIFDILEMPLNVTAGVVKEIYEPSGMNPWEAASHHIRKGTTFTDVTDNPYLAVGLNMTADPLNLLFSAKVAGLVGKGYRGVQASRVGRGVKQAWSKTDDWKRFRDVKESFGNAFMSSAFHLLKYHPEFSRKKRTQFNMLMGHIARKVWDNTVTPLIKMVPDQTRRRHILHLYEKLGPEYVLAGGHLNLDDLRKVASSGAKNADDALKTLKELEVAGRLPESARGWVPFIEKAETLEEFIKIAPSELPAFKVKRKRAKKTAGPTPEYERWWERRTDGTMGENEHGVFWVADELDPITGKKEYVNLKKASPHELKSGAWVFEHGLPIRKATGEDIADWVVIAKGEIDAPHRPGWDVKILKRGERLETAEDLADLGKFQSIPEALDDLNQLEGYAGMVSPMGRYTSGARRVHDRVDDAQIKQWSQDELTEVWNRYHNNPNSENLFMGDSVFMSDDVRRMVDNLQLNERHALDVLVQLKRDIEVQKVRMGMVSLEAMGGFIRKTGLSHIFHKAIDRESVVKDLYSEIERTRRLQQKIENAGGMQAIQRAAGGDASGITNPQLYEEISQELEHINDLGFGGEPAAYIKQLEQGLEIAENTSLWMDNSRLQKLRQRLVDHMIKTRHEQGTIAQINLRAKQQARARQLRAKGVAEEQTQEAIRLSMNDEETSMYWSVKNNRGEAEAIDAVMEMRLRKLGVAPEGAEGKHFTRAQRAEMLTEGEDPRGFGEKVGDILKGKKKHVEEMLEKEKQIMDGTDGSKIFDDDFATIIGYEKAQVAMADLGQRYISVMYKHLEKSGLLVPASKVHASSNGRYSERAMEEYLQNVGGLDQAAIKRAMHEGFEFVELNTGTLVGDFMFPKGFAKEAKRIVEVVNNEKGQLDAFLKTYAKWQGMWKAWTLAIFPAYHTRNAISNVFNNWLAGMDYLTDSRLREEGVLVQRMVHKARLGIDLDDADKIFGELTEKAMWDRMVFHGIVNSGEAAGELGNIMQRGEHFGLIKFAGTERELRKIGQTQGRRSFKRWALSAVDPRPDMNVFVQTGFDVGTYIEDHARASHYVWALRKGKKPMEARESVFKYLFDYKHGLTDFEDKYFRNFLMPFYAWTRFNLPLQLEMLVKNPHKVNMVGKSAEAWEDNFGGPEPNEIFQAQWMKRSWGIRLGYDKKKKIYSYFMMDNVIPLADIGKVFNKKSLGDLLMNLLTPGMKVPLESLYNFNLFRKKKISKFDGDKDLFFKGTPFQIEADAYVGHVARSIRFLNTIDKLISKSGLSTKGKVFSVLIGKAYPFDPNSQRLWWTRNLSLGIKELETAKAQALRYGTINEAVNAQIAIDEAVSLRAAHGASDSELREYIKNRAFEKIQNEALLKRDRYYKRYKRESLRNRYR